MIKNGESSRVFTAMAGNKAGEKNQGSSMHFYTLMDKVSFLGSKISLISRFELIISARPSCTRKLLRLFCREKLCKKTLYSRLVSS